MKEFFFDHLSVEQFCTVREDIWEDGFSPPRIEEPHVVKLLETRQCPHCKMALLDLMWWCDGATQVSISLDTHSWVCDSCGFWLHERESLTDEVASHSVHVSTLRTFDLSEKYAPQEAVMSWLQRHPSDVSRVHHRKLELVVQDILREHFDCEFMLTAETRDGGADLIAFDSDGGQILVEVKGFAPGRKVGVEFVRSLVGVLVRENAFRGLLVSRSGFTRDALAEASMHSHTGQRTRLDLELLQATDLLAALQVSRAGATESGRQYWLDTIRPRVGRFIADEEEFEAMRALYRSKS